MKRSVLGGLVVFGCVAVGLAWSWESRSKAHLAAAAAADAAPPVAQVRSELPRVQSLAKTLSVLGDVTASQTSGLSFARAGQVAALSVVVGDKVAKGATLATLTPDPASRQAYQQAVDAAALAQRELERQTQLLASHLATQSQVDSAEKAARDARGAVTALNEQDGARGTSQLLAPFDGVVTTVTAIQGDRVQAGAPVLQVGRTDALRVLMGIEPSERANVHAGTRATVWPVVGPGSTAPPIDLAITQMQDAVDPKTQLVEAVAAIPRGLAAQLASGMKVRAQLQVGALSAVAVSRSAVLTDERGDYVFQILGGKAHRVAVVRRLDTGALVAIDGLTDMKSPVVVEGNYELQDGMAVKEAAR